MSIVEEFSVTDFSPVKCAGCGKLAPISTKIGTGMTCPCGVVHTAVAIDVKSSGVCSSPDWQEAQTAHARAQRAESEKVKASTVTP
jgi:hypothetical protein